MQVYVANVPQTFDKFQCTILHMRVLTNGHGIVRAPSAARTRARTRAQCKSIHAPNVSCLCVMAIEVGDILAKVDTCFFAHSVPSASSAAMIAGTESCEKHLLIAGICSDDGARAIMDVIGASGRPNQVVSTTVACWHQQPAASICRADA